MNVQLASTSNPFRRLSSTDTDLPSTHSSSSSPSSLSSSSSSYNILIAEPCHLQSVPPPILSLILSYTPDPTALHLLTTSHHHHTHYHAYPIKQPLPTETVLRATRLDVYFRSLDRSRLCFNLCWLFFITISNTRTYIEPLALSICLSVLSGALFACALGWCVVLWVRAFRTDCCAGERRFGPWRRGWMPRIVRLSEELTDIRLLRYLKHLTELEITSTKHHPIGNKRNPLPSSLHTLKLNNSPYLNLTHKTLPPHLTTLSLAALHTAPLPPHVLPQSLTRLRLAYGFDGRWPIVDGVLPGGLVRLEVDEWVLPLGDMALPAGLVELDVHWLSNNPLPKLPGQLEVLRIGGAFSQSLEGVLPATLRVLRLVGHFSQSLTAEVFADVQQLEELHMSDHITAQQAVVSMLPRSLTVLRLGKRYSTVGLAGLDLPPQLRRLIVPASLQAGRLRDLQQLGGLRGFTVEQEASGSS